MLDVMTPEQVADLLQLNTETIFANPRQEAGSVKIGALVPHHQVAWRRSWRPTALFMPTLRDALLRRAMAIAERQPGRQPDDLPGGAGAARREAKGQVHAQRR